MKNGSKKKEKKKVCCVSVVRQVPFTLVTVKQHNSIVASLQARPPTGLDPCFPVRNDANHVNLRLTEQTCLACTRPDGIMQLADGSAAPGSDAEVSSQLGW